MHIISANLNKRGAALTLPTKDCRPPLAPGRRNSSATTNEARLAELTFVQIMGADPLADARILLSRQLLLSRSSALFVPTKPYGRTHARNHRASSAARRAPLDAVRSSVRTLQRQLALHRLLFVLIRQAVRITIAGHRIRTSTESFAMTAQAAFYFDSAHMIHAWQTACGVTPSAYRSIATLSARGR